MMTDNQCYISRAEKNHEGNDMKETKGNKDGGKK